MIKVVAKRKFSKENLQKAIDLYSELINETRKEKGCIAYNLFQDTNNECILSMIEEWESKEYLDVHSKSEHFTRLVPQIGKLGEGEATVNTYRKLR